MAVILWLLGSVCAALAVLYLLIGLGSHGDLSGGGWLLVAVPAGAAALSFVLATR